MSGSLMIITSDMIGHSPYGQSFNGLPISTARRTATSPSRAVELEGKLVHLPTQTISNCYASNLVDKSVEKLVPQTLKYKKSIDMELPGPYTGMYSLTNPAPASSPQIRQERLLQFCCFLGGETSASDPHKPPSPPTDRGWSAASILGRTPRALARSPVRLASPGRTRHATRDMRHAPDQGRATYVRPGMLGRMWRCLEVDSSMLGPAVRLDPSQTMDGDLHK